jgi:hypothetical protein
LRQRRPRRGWALKRTVFISVIFGAPLDDPYQKEHAVAAALEMQNDHRRCRYVRVQSFG